MKTLKNSFTTPNQSKRLLELGVPADSADCFYLKVNPVEDYIYVLTDNRTYTEQAAVSEYKYSDFIPCWSVGRIIEIMKICSIPVTTWYIRIDSKQPVLEFLLNELEISVIERDIDFSRLEE